MPLWQQVCFLSADMLSHNTGVRDNRHIMRERINPTSRSSKQFSGGKPTLNSNYYHPDPAEARVQAASIRRNIQIRKLQ